MNTFSFYASKKYLVKRWAAFFCILSGVRYIFFIKYSLLKKIVFALSDTPRNSVKRFASSWRPAAGWVLEM